MKIPLITHVLARAIIIANDHILLCKTTNLHSNFYFTPGGHIEPTENAKQALRRELLEETGFCFVVKRFLGCFEYAFDLNIKHPSTVCHSREYSFFFEATSEYVNNQVIIPKIENHIEVVWIPLTEIPLIDLKPIPIKKLINIWLEKNFEEAFFESQ